MSKFSVKKPFTIFVAVIAVLVLGVVSYLNMTPDLLPNMDFPYVMIMTTYPGASPEKVEAEVTKPMEQAMSTLEHIVEVSSTSAENYSMLLLEFEEDVNLDAVGVDIQQNLTSLSAGWDEMVGAPYVLKINPSLLPIAAAAVAMDGMDTVELTEFLEEELLNKLEGVPGVARITANGMVEQQLHVILDQQKIDEANRKLADAIQQKMLAAMQAASGLQTGSTGLENQLTSGQSGLEMPVATLPDLNKMLTMDLVSSILTAQNFSMPAGYVEQDGISYMVSVGDLLEDEAALADMVLFDPGMEGIDPIRLSDVAAVMLMDNRTETYARLDRQDSVVLSFEKQSTFATAEATDNLQKRFGELESAYPGLRFVLLMNQGDYIYLIVESILSSLLLGAVFAILILLLFLKDLRPTFITLCSIPVSVVFAVVLMYFSGVTINMISLSGLAVAVGMLVDNSVVVIENIYRLRSKGANAVQAAVSGAAQVVGAVTASTLTTVCVFLPIVFVKGITRQLFTDLALTMTYALLASLIVSLTLVPAMASGMLRKEKVQKDRIMQKLLKVYEKTARWSLNHKPVVLVAAAVLLVASSLLSLSRGFIFMPEMDMPNITVSVAMPEDVTMEEASGLADTVLERIATLDGIETVGAMMSASGTAMLTGGGNYDVTVYVTLSDEKASGSEMSEKITELCADLPCTVSGSSAMMDMSMLTGNGISLQIFSNDMEDLQRAARAAAAALSGVEGISEISDGLEETVPALHVSIDRNKAMEKGITVAQIYMELAAALQDTATATSLELDGTATDVIIQKPEGAKLTGDTLGDYVFEVTSQTGETTTFQLSEVAEIQQTTSLQTISRLSQRRYVTVSATLEAGQNITRATAAAQREMRQIQLPDGVSYAFSGENEMIMEAMEQLALMLALGVLLVYLVMVAQFQSLKSPFIVMFTIPLAFTGGFVGLLLCGMEVSVISLIGFVMLTGIIVNNGIVLVDYINQLRQEGMSCREAVVEAGMTRMRPILMTSVTTILGLMDMALRQNVGTALMRPVAVVCIGGLIYATLMTLFVVPCIYELMNRKDLRTVRQEDLEILDL